MGIFYPLTCNVNLIIDKNNKRKLKNLLWKRWSCLRIPLSRYKNISLNILLNLRLRWRQSLSEINVQIYFYFRRFWGRQVFGITLFNANLFHRMLSTLETSLFVTYKIRPMERKTFIWLFKKGLRSDRMYGNHRVKRDKVFCLWFSHSIIVYKWKGIYSKVKF